MNSSALEEVLLRGIRHAPGRSLLVLDCPSGASPARLSSAMPGSAMFFFNRDFADYSVIAPDLDPDSCRYGAWYSAAEPHDSAVVFLPRGRENLLMTLNMVRQAIKPGGVIMVAGEKRGGMGAARTLLEETCGSVFYSESARHCVTIAGRNPGPGGGPGSLDGWMTCYQAEVSGVKLEISSCPGVFCHGRVDPATALLVDSLERDDAKSVLDFGCGSGIIGSVVSLKWEGVAVDMLDSSALAVESARRTAEANGLKGARILASDCFSSAGSGYDLIVSNPPFHSGPTIELGVIEMLWREAEERLNPSGRLVLVTSGAVPARLTAEGGMKNVRVLASNRNYRVTEASK